MKKKPVASPKKRAAHRPTLREVAAVAGITPATASYVLSGSTSVSISASTRERVIRAADQVGYRPHLAARSLVTGRTRTIGLCFGEEGAIPFADDYDREVLHGVLKGAASAGYALQVVDSLGGSMPHDVDGWIAVQTPPQFDLSRLGRAPVVFLDPFDPLPRQVCMWADNAGGGSLLASQLAGQHRAILCLLHEPLDRTPYSYRERLLAFRTRWDALVPGGRIETEILHPDVEKADGEGFLKRWRNPIRRGEITHIACLSDMQAARVSAFLRKADIRVPEDVTLSGFDNTLHSRLAFPGISTVDFQAVLTAQDAVERLIGILAGDPPKAWKPHPPAWVDRESTRRAELPLGEAAEG